MFMQPCLAQGTVGLFLNRKKALEIIPSSTAAPGCHAGHLPAAGTTVSDRRAGGQGRRGFAGRRGAVTPRKSVGVDWLIFPGKPTRQIPSFHGNKMQPTNPNAHTHVNGDDVETHGYAVTRNTFLQ